MSGHESESMKQAMLERSVIASVIAGDALPSGLMLEEAHFHDPLCRQLYRALSVMEKRRQEIDLVSVCMADETLDAQAVVNLSQERCVSEVLLRQHCAAICDRGRRRQLETILEEGLAAVKKGGDLPAQTEAIRERLKALMSAGEGADVTMLELLVRVLSRMEGKEREKKPPIPCGIAAIDESLSGGFRPGDLVVIAALTGVGKSAMLSFMMRNAAELGKKILLVSCEMSDDQNAERFLASISGVDLSRIMRRETLSQEENIRICDGMDRYHPERIRVISSGTQTVSSVRREALRMQAGMGLDMIVVDYLQRLHPDRTHANKADEVGSIASGLKSMAADLGVPVLTASQFNREAAKARREAYGSETAGVPALHQMRDSSQIEDEANTVIVLDEPRREPNARVRRINAHVIKNRSGALRAARLLFDPAKMIFTPAPSAKDAFL